jgi:probable selenate reductase FAD-binding subunit
MVTKFLKPSDAAEALAMLAGEAGALPLAGGTFLLSSQFKDWPFTAVSVAGILPRGIRRAGSSIEIGANATFQDLSDSKVSPGFLRQAALGMASRNVRNRATAGGNAGANRSCSSLLPVLLVAECRLEMATARGRGSVAPELVRLDEWIAAPEAFTRALISSLSLEIEAARRYAYRRWSRTACDLAVLGAAVSYVLSPALSLQGLRIALGGLGPRARRFPELEELFEGAPLPGREEVEAAVAPLLAPISDARGSAAFKRLRAAALVADALASAEAQP